MHSEKTFRWGILAGGAIAARFAKALHETERAVPTGVACREAKRAEEFAAAQGISKAYGGYEAMLADPEIDAVYIATLHPFHHEWTLRALRAGKHVLCEKPLAMNLREAKQMGAVAKEERRLLREAFMYRHHPQTQRVVDLVRSGAVGTVRLVEAEFCFDGGDAPDSRLQARDLGGGAILDIGCYAASFIRLIAGRQIGRPFAEPIELKAVGHLDPRTRTDSWTSAVMRFEGGLVGRATVAVRLAAGARARIVGDGGEIAIESPWFCGGGLSVKRHGSEEERIDLSSPRDLYSFEIEAFQSELSGLPVAPDAPGMRFDDTLGNMRTLDWWRSEIGLRYPADRPGGEG